MMKIIINADDFGMTKYVNQAIFDLANKGVLTSTTVMVNMPYWKEISNLISNETISIGLHINLTEGRPVTNPVLVKSLVDENGVFFEPAKFRELASKGLIDREHVFIEISNQYKLLSDYIGSSRIDHFDSHQGSNKIKVVHKALIKLSKIFEKKLAIRVYTKHYIAANKDYLTVTHPYPWTIARFGIRRILVETVWRFRTREISKYFNHINGLLLHPSHKAIDIFKSLVNKKINKENSFILEIAFHPATRIDDLPSEMRESRVIEYDYLMNQEIIRKLKEFKLVNYSLQG